MFQVKSRALTFFEILSIYTVFSHLRLRQTTEVKETEVIEHVINIICNLQAYHSFVQIQNSNEELILLEWNY